MLRTYENRLIAILFLAFGTVFLDRMSLNFLVPFFINELHLNNTQVGLLGGITAISWAVAGVVFGVLSDRFDTRKPLLVVAVLVFAMFSGLSGVVGGFVTLLAFRSLMGAAEGVVIPLSTPLVMADSTPRRRGLNMGLLQSAGGVLGGLAGPVIVVAIAEHYGWRHAFYLTALPALVTAVLIMAFVRDRKARSAVETGIGTPVETGSRTPRIDLAATLKALKQRNVVICLLIAACYFAWFVTTQTFVPLYLVQHKGYSASTMSWVAAGLGIAWTVWGAVIPAVSDRFGRKPTIIAFTAVATLSPLAVVFVSSPALLLPLLVISYTGIGCFGLFSAAIPSESVPPELVATTIGLIIGTGETVGGFLVPTLAGHLADLYGLDITLYLSAGAAAVSLVLCLFLTETAPSATGALAAPGQVSPTSANLR